jgi:hypothetical protein
MVGGLVDDISTVQRVEIQILVDNTRDEFSGTSANVEGELAFALHRGLR